MRQLKETLAQELSENLGVEVEAKDIEVPEPEHGDFAYPAMKAASKKEVNPRALAEDAAESLTELEIVEKVKVAGPGYLNFFLNSNMYADAIEETISSEKMGAKTKHGNVLLEFSSPNIAKPMHVGHLRNNCLGDSLQRILDFVGYDVTSENYVGDMGTQFGKVIYGHLHLDSEKSFEEEPMEYMLDIYVKFHKEAEENPDIEEEAAKWAKKIENGDEEAVEMWKEFRDASLEYQKQEYEKLDIEFDRYTGESKVTTESKKLMEEWVEKGILERDEDGSVFYEFEDEDLPGAVLLKADDTTLYLTRDIYNLKKRNEEGFDHNLYVVATEQNLHFRQLFALAEEVSIGNEGSEHVSFGMLSLPEGSMSTREGRIIRQWDIMEKAIEKVEKKTEDREIDNAEAVGIGAVKYANLSVSRKKDIEFEWDSILTFEGDSGPYLQYTNTRAKSILRKSEVEPVLTGDLEDEEKRILKKLGEFPEQIEEAAESRDPVKISSYLSSLCEEFNTFYHSCPVLDAEEETKKRRLRITELFIEVTDQGLELLGIEPLEEM